MEITIDGLPLIVEVADTDEKMAQGFQNRLSVPIDHGMLFDLGATRDVSYHTRNCLWPMDIIFLGADRAVIKTLHAVPPGRDSLDCPAARWVVETNGGWAKDNGIEQGSVMRMGQEAMVASIVRAAKALYTHESSVDSIKDIIMNGI